MKEDINITELQWIALLFGVMVGIGITTLPRELVEKTARDGWITAILATIVVMIYAKICLYYAELFPSKTLPESIQLVLGKWIGSAVIVIFSLYTFIVSGIVIRSFLEIIHIYFDITAPAWIKTFLPLVAIIYMARCGMGSVARMAELVFILTVPFTGILLSPTRQCHINHILPIFEKGVLAPITALPVAIFGFLGVETVILVFYPYLQKKNTATRATYIGISLVGLLYTFIALTTLLVMGVEQTEIFYWPFVEVLKTVKVVIIERIDNLFLYFWSVKITMVAAIMYFAGTFSLSILTNKKYHDIWAIICWPLIYLVSIFPDSLVELEEISAIISKYAGIFVLTLPLVLISVAKIRGVRDDSHAEKHKTKANKKSG